MKNNYVEKRKFLQGLSGCSSYGVILHDNSERIKLMETLQKAFPNYCDISRYRGDYPALASIRSYSTYIGEGTLRNNKDIALYALPEANGDMVCGVRVDFKSANCIDTIVNCLNPNLNTSMDVERYKESLR